MALKQKIVKRITKIPEDVAQKTEEKIQKIVDTYFNLENLSMDDVKQKKILNNFLNKLESTNEPKK